MQFITAGNYLRNGGSNKLGSPSTSFLRGFDYTNKRAVNKTENRLDIKSNVRDL